MFAGLAIVAALTVKDYGVTWDEPEHNDYGQAVVRYYSSGLREVPQNMYMNLYGAGFDFPAVLLEKVSPLGAYPTRHIFNVVIGVLGILGAWKTAGLIAGPAAGFWSALLLVLTPCYYGHMFNNPKDLPFAAGYIWSLYYILRVAAGLPRPSASLVLRLGLAMGLSLGVRIGALLLPGYLLLACILRRTQPWRARFLPALAACAIAAVVMFLCWPYAQHHPLWPFTALGSFMRYTARPFSVLFGGKMIYGTDLPWDYLPTHLAITLPELVIVLLLAGLVMGARVVAASKAGRAIRFESPAVGKAGRAPESEAYGIGLLALSAILPVALVILKRPVLYNGIRHFLFIVPPLVCLGGIVLAHLIDSAGRLPAVVRPTAAALLGAYLAWHVSVMVRYHPHQYIYYNRFAGGLPGVYYRYDLDYWGNSYPEAVDALISNLKIREGDGWASRRYRVRSCGAPKALAAELPSEFAFTEEERETDFLIGLVGYGCEDMNRGVEIARIERFGVPLSYVRDMRARGR